MEPHKSSENHISTVQAETPSPIHRLPPELLAKVFLFLRAPYWSRKMGIPWVTATQVCRWWRDVAYECATLWSYIFAFPPHIIERSLQLSKSSPLDVKIHLFGDSAILPLGKAISRIRRLNVALSTYNWGMLRSLFAAPAPLLESLSLFLMGHHPNESKRLDELLGITPRLRYLSLSRCGVDFSSPFLTNLTILEICDPQPLLGALDFLSFLRKMPQLTSLRMCYILQSSMNGHPNVTCAPIPPHTKVVKLSSLGLLSIYGLCSAQDLDFLSHLSFPATTILLFSSGYTYQNRCPFVSISDFLKVHASTQQNYGDFAPTRMDLSLLYGMYKHLKLEIWDDHKLLWAFQLNCLDEEEEDPYVISDEPEMERLFSSLSFPSITGFSTNCHIGRFAWPIISTSFPQLQCVSVEEKTETATVLQAIIDDYRRNSSPLPNWTPIFPRLRSLFVIKADVVDVDEKYLVQALQCRRKTSRGLDCLKLSECVGVDKKLVESLREVEGLDVDWSAWNPDGKSMADLEGGEESEEEPGEIDLHFDPLYAGYYVDNW